MQNKKKSLTDILFKKFSVILYAFNKNLGFSIFPVY